MKHSNDTPKLNIHKYTNYKIIEIRINRLSITTQIFITMDYYVMIRIQRSTLILKKEKKMTRTFFPPLRSNCIYVLRNYIWNYVFLKDMYKNLMEIGTIQAVSKLTIFINL